MKRVTKTVTLGLFLAMVLVAGVVVASSISTGGNALRSLGLNQFAATTSAQFFGVISDETGGSGGVVVGSSGPTLTATTTANNLNVAGTFAVTGLTTHRAEISLINNGASTVGLNVTATTSGTSVKGTSTTGIGLWGIATGNGTGVVADNSTDNSAGYALDIRGDLVNTSFPPVKWAPTSANPANGAIGDLFMLTGGILRVAVATNPAFISVSNTGTTSTVGAAGTNQGNAAGLGAGADWVTVTGCDATKGVTLPAGAIARCVRVMSQSSTVTNTCKVYGDNGENDTINGGAADAAYTQIAGVSLVYCTSDGTNWFTY